MLVSRTNFAEVVAHLSTFKELVLDVESSGLRPFHGDRLFSIAIACSPSEAYYFNIQAAPDIPTENVLTKEHIEGLTSLLGDPTKVFIGHGFRFDIHMLFNEGLEIAGEVYCTQSGATLENNTFIKYNLDSCLERIGLSKSTAVEDYISEHGLWDWEEIPGKKVRKKNKHFDRVPFNIISAYAEQDATTTFALYRHQQEVFKKIIDATPPNLPNLLSVIKNEQRLLKVLVGMERVGVKIDREFVVQGVRHEDSRASNYAREFEERTGRPFKDSAKDFEDIFQGEREKWQYTEKGAPSFNYDALSTFDHPAARTIINIRDAQSRGNFFKGFLYHADKEDIVHPGLNPAGAAATGRMSSNSPNLQNMSADELGLCTACGKPIEDAPDVACGDKNCHQYFVIRRSFIPRPGYVFLMVDYSQMEYVLMFDYANQAVGYETDIVTRIKGGLDVHQAMADTVTAAGFPLTRSRAKNGNFAVLYGSGDATFASTVGCTIEEARRIRHAIARSAPEVDVLVGQIMRTAKVRGYVFNWLGRRYQFPDQRWCYRAPNYMCQGGSADIFKVAMNRIGEYLLGKKSRMLLPIHDELLIEVHESEISTVPPMVKEIMEAVYPWKYLPLQVSVEHSYKSFGDKIKGFPA